jgi:hypothetical protein
VAQHIEVVDRVCAGGHARHDRGDLRPCVRSLRPAQGEPLVGQIRQSCPLGQPHHRHQARLRHEIRIIEDHRHRAGPVRRSHQQMPFCSIMIIPSQERSSQAEGHLRARDTTHHQDHRWIQVSRTEGRLGCV